MLDDIVAKLHADTRLSGWQVREIRKRSQQLFLNKDRTESQREVEALGYEVEVLINHQRKQADQTQAFTGSSRFVTDQGSFSRFEQDLNQAVFAAGLVDNEPYRMTDPGPLFPNFPLADPALESGGLKALQTIAQRLRDGVGKEKGVRLAAAEFFADRIFIRHINSQGLQAAQNSTLFNGEYILLAERLGGESEVFKAFKRRRLQDFEVEQEIRESAELGRQRTKAELPKTGIFDVVFSGEALDNLFDWFVTQASGAAKYNRLVQNELEQMILNAEAGATPLTLWHNAELPWAVGSYRFDPSGVPACRRMLLQRGRLVHYWANARYAQYLKLEASGELGNIEVEPGGYEETELLKPNGRPLYHLFEFSYFEPNTITGEFSAEIRGGEEISVQGRRPIKGGSVSGSSAKAIGSAFFSSSKQQRERYLGPKVVRCSKLTLAGE